MKPVIYIDILFMINFLIDSLIIYSTSLILKRDIHIFRLTLSSALSALYASAMFFPQLSLIYTFFFKMLFLTLAVNIAFPVHSLIELIKNTIVFWGINALFGGITFSLIFLTKFGIMMGAVVSNGEIYFNVDLGTLMTSSIVSYILIYVFSYVRKCGINHAKLITDLKIDFEGSSITVKAFADTGCKVTEPFTQKSVIILGPSAAKNLISKEFSNAIIRNFSNPDDKKYLKYYRMIPYNTLDSTGFMDAFVPGRIELKGVLINNVIIGISKKELSANYEFDAIFNPDIFSDANQINSINVKDSGRNLV